MADIDIDLAQVLTTPEEDQKSVGDAVVDMAAVHPDSSARDNMLAGWNVLIQEREQELTAYAAAIASANKEGDFVDAASNNRDAVFRNAQQAIRATMETDPDGLLATVNKVNTEIIQSDDRIQSPIADEKELVKSITTVAPVDVSEGIEKEEAFRLAALKDLSQLIENQGTWDRIADFSGFFLPFNLTADLSDVLDTKFDWTNAVDIGQFVMDWKGLPVERKQEYWPEVVNAIVAATGTTVLGVETSDKNVLKAAGILMQLLNPQGAEKLSDERTLDILFGLADIIPVGLIGSAVTKLRKSTNLVKVTANLGDPKRAAQMDMAAIVDDDAAKALGLPRQDAATNAIPVKQSALSPEHTEGLSTEISKSLNEFQRQAQGLIQSLLNEGILLKEGLLVKSEKLRIIEDELTELQKLGTGEDVLNEGIHFQNFEAKNITEAGADITYEVVKEGKVTLKVTKPIKWVRDNVSGMFRETTDRAIPGFENGASNAAWAHTGPDGDFMASVKAAIRLADSTAAAQNAMLDLVNAANKPVTGILKINARKRLRLAEIEGDEWIDKPTGTHGRVWTQEELSSRYGITSPAEVEAYFRRRIVADQFFTLENHASRRQWEIFGFKGEVTLNGDKFISKTLDNLQAATSSTRDKKGEAFFNSNTGESVLITDDALKEAYEQGNVLVRLPDNVPVRHLDNSVEHFEFALVSRTDIGPLPARVINYKPGYVPKINKGVEYLVKEMIPGMKRGATTFFRPMTHRFFASKKEANIYRDQQVAKFLDDNPGADLEMAQTRFPEPIKDREMTPIQKLQESLGSSGGLYTGARASHDIVSGLAGVDVKRVSSFDAFQRNAQHLGTLITRNEWRIGQEQKWLNTIESYGYKNDGFNGTQISPGPNVANALIKEREIIKHWNGIPTLEENALQAGMQNLHDWMLNGVRKVPGLSSKDSIPSLLYLKHSNPLSAMKTASFHLFLGAMVPAQLFVQGASLTVAASRFPLIALRAGAYAFKLSFTDMVKDSNALTRVSRGLEKMDDTTPLFDEIRQAWTKTGLSQGVRQNADLAAVDSYGAVSLGALKRLGDASLLFYRPGELFNRRFSFVASYLDWKKKNPGKRPNTDELKLIQSDANLSMLELNHGNRAFWQGGPNTGVMRNVLGNMLQFQQVGAKAIELFTKGPKRGGFTVQEKGRIALGQFAFFGAAGIPLGNAIVGEAVDWLDVELTEAEKTGWSQGIIGAIVVNAFGAEISVSPRGAPFGQTTQFVRDLLFDDTNLLKKSLGPFESVGGRLGTAFSLLRPMMLGGLEGEKMSKEDLIMAATITGQVLTSTRSLLKAWIMASEHKIRDRHGKTIVFDDFNWQTVIGTAMGFKPLPEVDTRLTQMSDKDYEDLITETADAIFALTLSYVRTAETDPRAAEKLEKSKQFIYESLNANSYLKKRVDTTLMNRMMDGESLQEKLIRKFIERQANDIDRASIILRRSFFANTLNENAVVQPFGGEK